MIYIEQTWTNNMTTPTSTNSKFNRGVELRLVTSKLIERVDIPSFSPYTFWEYTNTYICIITNIQLHIIPFTYIECKKRVVHKQIHSCPSQSCVASNTCPDSYPARTPWRAVARPLALDIPRCPLLMWSPANTQWLGTWLHNQFQYVQSGDKS